MVIYWIMFIYTVVVSFLIETENKQRKHLLTYQNNTAIQSVGIFGAMVAFLAIIVLTGVRGHVADTTAYINAFQMETRSLSDIPALFADFTKVKGPLWIALQIFVKNYIYDDVTVMLMLVAAFQGFAVAKIFSRYSDYFTFSSYLFMAGYSFFWMFNGTRQFTAVCIILLASKYLFNQQTKFFVFWVLVATSFHSTAILCIIACFIVQGQPFNKKIIWSIIIALLCIVFLEQFTGIIDSALEDTNYNTLEAGNESEGGMNPLVTLMNAVPLILVWWRRKFLFTIDRPKYIDVIINLSCFNIGICLIANFTSGITFGRLPIYFTIYNYILLPWIIEKCFFGIDRTIIKFCCIIFYFAYFLYQSYGPSSGGVSYSSLYWRFFYENFSIKLF